MLVSYQWLKRYVDIEVTPEVVAEALTMAGITVDLVTYPTAGIRGVVVGKILAIEPHPDADRLRICRVDVASEVLQIVTGATNVQEGDTVPVACCGARLAGGVKISRGKLRGVESLGMLCSLQELGLEEHSEGIWLLPEDLPLGGDLTEILMLDDAVLDLDLTPNRSDCLSIINVAREVSAVLNSPLHLPEISYAETTQKIEDFAKVEVQAPDLCPRYLARLVRNVQLGESPLWMQHFLRTAGIRPINNVVDVSNFVLLEWGQPLHTFDYDTLAGGKIIVRRALDGEKMVTLDEKERELNREMLLICDEQAPVCVAGVMGGLNSGVAGSTTNILLETAAFAPVNIRHTSKDLALRSESSIRFEKGVDLANADLVSRRAIQLLCELCGGEAVAGSLDVLNAPLPTLHVDLRLSRVNEVLGTSFTPDEVIEALVRLKFDMERKSDNLLCVTVPSFRQDISSEIDLVEEVARLHGYDSIPTTLPSGEMTQGRLTERQAFADSVNNFAISSGFHQVVNYGFVNPKMWDKLNLPADCRLRRNVKIMNPLNEDQGVMRTTLLPGILATAAYNQSRRNNDLLLFEQGSIFEVLADEELPCEQSKLTMLAVGSDGKSWLAGGSNYDFYFLKGVLEGLFQSFSVAHWSVKATTAYPYLHPGRAAEVYVGGKACGYLGELHPAVARNFDLSGRVNVLQVDLDSIFAASKHVPAYRSLPKFPASTRDMALVARDKVAAADIEELIWSAGGSNLARVQLFDVYSGAQVADGYRSLAYGLVFQAQDRTLTDEEVGTAFAAILQQLKERYEITLRV